MDAIRNGNGAVTMHRGMGGPEVQDLQRRLNAMGASPPLAVDGKFGPKTEAALKAYQSANGIQQTGVLGRQTLGSLDNTNARRIPASAPQAPGTNSAQTVDGSTLTGSAFGNQVAAAAEREARQLNSVGRCALGVNNALTSLGVQGLGHAYQKAEQLANNPRFREVNVSANDLTRLPPGAVVVWGRSAAKPYGHVSVALGGGREASDHIQRQITGGRYGTDFGRGPDPQGRQFRVFLPA
jgi:peptidoglycan hydrolase-like protein with peptidoglycan-binding domain